MEHIKNHHRALGHAVKALLQGQVIAYPTEAIYGLGCDPFNDQAVKCLLAMKKRNANKGLILVASNWAQCSSLILPIEPMAQAHIENSHTAHTTWVLPASQQAPAWITGQHSSIAIRISDHPVIHDLCTHFGGPIVSTSANLEGFPPIRDLRTLEISFGKHLAFIMPGPLGNASSPSKIINAVTGEILRK